MKLFHKWTTSFEQLNMAASDSLKMLFISYHGELKLLEKWENLIINEARCIHSRGFYQHISMVNLRHLKDRVLIGVHFYYKLIPPAHVLCNFPKISFFKMIYEKQMQLQLQLKFSKQFFNRTPPDERFWMLNGSFCANFGWHSYKK